MLGPDDERRIAPPLRVGGLFVVDRVHRAAGVILVLVGELDLAALTWAGYELERATSTGGVVVADLRRLEFIDCTGIGALVGADRRLRGAGGRLVVVPGNRAMRGLFGIVGLGGRLDFAEDPEEVLAQPARWAER